MKSLPPDKPTGTCRGERLAPAGWGARAAAPRWDTRDKLQSVAKEKLNVRNPQEDEKSGGL